ncbi:hypothetical protein VOI54_12615 [Tamlana sp. 2201CG12-4]|uniref:hypothetical protein n=1 Tax=Tamlana sp. 2201CG12-4 TaxID=3112582 RepID=UPI002DC0587C|nr:hypothetical protein [Tamlana sp. 2201CG12-4]MEC3907864.1 hypothetical protein [Tamlana sp. 2201CG12-4]
MKKIYNIGLTILAVFAFACTDNPLEEVEGKAWQKERNIVSILVEGQIGTAIIERNFDEAKIKIFAKVENIADLSKVEIKDIQLSYGASTINEAGTTLDLTDGTSTIYVKSGAGETLEWELSLNSFKSDLEGTWYVGDIRMYCDMFTWESWGWEKNESIFGYLPELGPEWDNEIIFTVEGADVNGNPFGNYEHGPGNNGEYGSFGDTGKGWDFNERFRKIPKGTGTWLRDFERNKLIITDALNVVHEIDLEVLTDTNEVVLKAAIPYLAELFDWNNIDWSYEELAHMSNPMWYTLTRERILQKGNSITSLTVKDQVGDTEINNDTKEVTVTIPDNGADLSMVEIESLGLPLAATASISAGETLDFSNNNEASITVTSESGEAAIWTIKLVIQVDPGDSAIAGTWTIQQIGMYCDLFTWESWGWDKYESINNYLSAVNPELDNTITFVFTGVNGDGNQYGTYENNSGTDGEYGDFVDTAKGWDFNNRFRKVPTESGTWVLVDDVLTITVNGGAEYVLTVEIKPSNTEIALTSEVEFLPDNFDWDVQDYNYEELAHMSKKMWYNLIK